MFDNNISSNKLEFLLKNEQYNNVISLCSQILEVSPNNYEVMYWRALAYSCSGLYDLALADYRIIETVFPNHAETSNNKGAAEIYLGLYELALKDFNVAININPLLYESYIGRINALINLNKLEEAKQDCFFLIEKQQYLELVYAQLAYIELKLDNINLSIKYSNCAISQNPNCSFGYIQRSAAFLQKGSGKKECNYVIKDCKIILSINPNCAIAFFNMGISYCNLKLYENAYECYTKALTLIDKTKINDSFIGRIEKADIYLRIAQILPIGDHRSLFLKRSYIEALTNWDCSEPTKVLLYKYKAFGRSEIDPNEILHKSIVDSTVWFSDFLQLNDARDGFVIQQVERNISEVDLIGFRELSFSVKSEFENINQEETMWGYYADGGNGVCLEYELDVNKLDNQNFVFSKVRYNNDKPYVFNTFSVKDFVNARLFTKSLLWSHEHEARIVMYDENYTKNPTGVSVKTDDIGLKLVGVRFGCRCKNEQITFIKNLVAKCQYRNITYSRIVHVSNPLSNGNFIEKALL